MPLGTKPSPDRFRDSMHLCKISSHLISSPTPPTLRLYKTTSAMQQQDFALSRAPGCLSGDGAASRLGAAVTQHARRGAGRGLQQAKSVIEGLMSDLID